MMAVTVSVIVPIYNAEKTIRKSLDSILCQTFKDFELLLIDDGSPDNCLSICNEYAAKDDRVRVYHKENGGLSSARNYGLERATGIYSIFVDPDDWVDSTALEELYNQAVRTNADMVICDFFRNDEYRQTYSDERPSGFGHYQVMKNILSGRLHGSTSNKLIRQECYKKYHISYPFGIYGCEDQYTMCALLKNDIKISYLNKAFYHYVYYPASLSRHYTAETYNMDVKILHMFLELLAGTEAYDIAKKSKSSAIATRAFMYGYEYFTSSEYAKTFRPYKQDVLDGRLSLMYRFLYGMSFLGFYRLMRKLFGYLFLGKRILKKYKIIR
jgi:glycosyltransferase involved in cell wall biosynthesis